MLPDGNAVREAVLGWQGGIAAALAPGAVILDMSSADPVGTQKLAADLAPLEIRVVDAPVSGGIARAETGTLSLMVGGQDEEAFARVRPVLETLGERIFRTGPLGSGHAMKALNNFLGATAYTAAAEALAIGKEFGLDPARDAGGGQHFDWAELQYRGRLQERRDHRPLRHRVRARPAREGRGHRGRPRRVGRRRPPPRSTWYGGGGRRRRPGSASPPTTPRRTSRWWPTDLGAGEWSHAIRFGPPWAPRAVKARRKS